MKQNSLKFLALAMMLGVVGPALGDTSVDEETLKAVAGYRQWTRVSEKALPVVDSSLTG